MLKATEKRTLQTEYLSSGRDEALFSALRSALPHYVDDVTRDFGSNTYERLLTDPAASSAFETYKRAILADGIRVMPAVEPIMPYEKPDAERAAQAVKAGEYAAFIERVIARMDTDLVDLADELLDGIAFGNKVAEIVTQRGTGEDAGREVIKTIRCKHRTVVGFVVDGHGNLLGLVGNQPGKPALAAGLISGDDMNKPEQGMYPRSKFIIFQHDTQDGDPRGTSALRPAYNAWFVKTHIVPEYYRYLQQFAGGTIVGKTVPADKGGQQFVPKTDESGAPVLNEETGEMAQQSAEQALYSALLPWLNASVIVVPGGAEVDIMRSEGDGKAFLEACDYLDRQITLAILGSTRMTLEAKHGSRADSNTAQDVFGLQVAFQKGRLAAVLTRDIIRLLMLINFGEESLELMPRFELSRVEQQDTAKLLEAYSKAYAAGFIKESQLPALHMQTGLPEADWEAEAQEKAEQRQMQRMAAGDLSKVMDPLGGADDEEDEAA
jgi:hypothetical protein